DDEYVLDPRSVASFDVHARLDRDHHPRLEGQRVPGDEMRVLEGGQTERVPAVMWKLALGYGLRDSGVHSVEDVGAGCARHERDPSLLQRVEEQVPCRFGIGM